MMFNIGPQCKEMNAQGEERVEKGTLSMVGVLEGEVMGGGGPGTLQEDNCGWDCRWIEMKKNKVSPHMCVDFFSTQSVRALHCR